MKFILLAVFINCIWICFTYKNSNGYVKKEMSKIEIQVAEDAVKQYEIAKSGGDAMDIYVHAGFVAAAYIQAKDEYNYKKWKEIEKEDGKRAGITE